MAYVRRCGRRQHRADDGATLCSDVVAVGREARQRVAGSAAPRAARTLIDDVYRRLRNDVITGRLAPGIRMKVEHLRIEYGVGASTVREALTRLCADGLALTEGQRGFRVAPVSMADLRDITELRRLLEGRALREAIANADDAWEAAIVAAFERLSAVESRLADDPATHAGEWEGCNRDFHRSLLARCASPRTCQFIELLHDQHERYRRLALVDRSVPRDVHAEHQAIFDAVITRDADLACRLAEQHIALTADVLARGIVDGAWFGFSIDR